MVITITSGECTVKCLLEGAMLHSLIKNKIEYLWQGNSKFWGGQAPVCFPITGVLNDGRAKAFGKECKMKRHGIARINPFEIKEHGRNYVVFIQKSTEETKKDFPFDYALEIKYTAVGCTVTTEYTVINTGSERLPFVIGGHPAFNCPLEEGESFDDYTVRFDRKMTKKCLRPDINTGLVDVSRRFNILDNTDIIRMEHSLFEDDALIFDNIDSKTAELIGKNGKGIRIEYQDFANLLIWSSSNGGNFVALEPWTGISNCSDEDEIFENKRGMTVLEPSEQASFKFKVTLI